MVPKHNTTSAALRQAIGNKPWFEQCLKLLDLFILISWIAFVRGDERTPLRTTDSAILDQEGSRDVHVIRHVAAGFGSVDPGPEVLSGIFHVPPSPGYLMFSEGRGTSNNAHILVVSPTFSQADATLFETLCVYVEFFTKGSGSFGLEPIVVFSRFIHVTLVVTVPEFHLTQECLQFETLWLRILQPQWELWYEGGGWKSSYERPGLWACVSEIKRLFFHTIQWLYPLPQRMAFDGPQ